MLQAIQLHSDWRDAPSYDWSMQAGQLGIVGSAQCWSVHCLLNVYWDFSVPGKVVLRSQVFLFKLWKATKHEDPVPARPDRGETRCADMSTPFGGMGVRGPREDNAKSETRMVTHHIPSYLRNAR